MKKYKIYLFIFLLIFGFSLYSQGRNEKKITLGEFSPYKSARNSKIEEDIKSSLIAKLEGSGYSVQESSAGSIPGKVQDSKKQKSDYMVSGYYTKKEGKNLEIYAQIYDPDSGKVIDAVSISQKIPELEGIELDKEEMKTSDDEVIDQAVEKTVIRIRSNPKKKVRFNNITENISTKEIGKDINFPLAKEDIAKQSEDVFKLLEDTKIVTASRSAESLMDVPATTMVITEQDFKNRGYTSLGDIFRDLPGVDFIGQQGTDNGVIYMRGYRTPFTSRVLLMIDGVLENDLWAQVATPDRMYPISNIKRVEVIYGPASAVYGPNAFQGIVNIITKDGSENGGKTITGKTSFMYGSGPQWAVDGGVTSQIGDFRLAMSARKVEGVDSNKNVSNYGYNTQFWINNPLIWGPVLLYGSGGEPFGKFSDPVNDWGTIIRLSYKTLKVGANITNKYEGYGAQYPGDKSQPNSMWGKTGKNIYAENVVEITSKLSSYSLIVYRDSRIYGDWAEADGYGYGNDLTSFDSYVSFTRWNQISRSGLANQNIEYKFNPNFKLMFGLKYEFKKLTKSYDIPGYWWGDSYFSSIDFLNPNVNVGVEDTFPNGYAIGLSSDPYILKGPSPKKNMPDENTIGTYDRGGFLLSTIDVGKFRFSPGIRYDRNSIYGQSINPRMTGIYKMNDRNAFKLLYGEAFNEPSPLNLFGGYAGRTADLRLKPEKEKTTEAIYMYRGKKISNELSIYYSRYDNVIKESAENAGKRRIYGLEYKFRWNVRNFINKSPPIRLYAYYTYTLALADTYYDHNIGEWKQGVTPLGEYEYLFPDEAQFIPRKRKYTNLGDIAPHKINLGINLPVKQLFVFNLRGNYVSRREFYSRNALQDNGPIIDIEDIDALLRRIVQQQDKNLDPYFVVDAAITMNFKHYGYFTFRVLNVLNTMYYHPGTGQANAGTYYYARSLGYDSSILPQYGRTFMANLTLTF